MSASDRQTFMCARLRSVVLAHSGALRVGVVLVWLSLAFPMRPVLVLGQTPALGESPGVAIDRADTLIRQGKTGEAIAVLDPLARKKPSIPGVETLLGKAYFTSKTYQQAILHLQRAMEQAPEDWESMQLLALSYYALGKCQETVPLLEKVSPHLPQGQADAPYILGVCYARTQQRENARKAFAEMFGVSPESPMAHLMLAKMLVRLQLEDQAPPEIEKALALEARLPMAHFLLGEIWLYKMDPQRALPEFQKELAINPSVWLVYWRLGDTYMRLKQYDEAEKALKQALWLNESFTGSYIMLGQIELQKGDPELARGFLERAVKLDPQNYYAHYALGRSYQKLGRTDDANREFVLQRSLRTEKHTAEEDTMEQMTH
jgi:tetratricopeptide (TPR) repeat protein